ncbi:MAG: MGMT family protein [Candidatus Cloacimonetes bacterium]|nr:MGMT family protein [Candidatus Cloacimonadota bacterium]
MSEFSKILIIIMKQIPYGKVASYSQIAALGGNRKAARQVSRLLHSASEKYNIAWHRIINSQGKISLPPGRGFEMQQSMLENEGITVHNGKVDLKKYQWQKF